MSNTSGGRQTVGIGGIRSDRFYCITGEKEEGKFIVEDQTADIVTGVETIRDVENKKIRKGLFDLSGRKLSTHKKKGIVIENGRKVAYN